MNKEYDLKLYQSKNNTGLNIDNFVNTFNFNNIMMREKIILFITYLEFFHKLHNKYFKRFTTKLQLMYGQIAHDIKFDDSEKANKTKNIDMLHSLEDEEVGKEVLKELKASINDVNTDTDGSSDFEMFDRLPTPKSISLDNEENQINVFVTQREVIKHKEGNLLDFENSVENSNEINNNTKIRLQVDEVLNDLKSQIDIIDGNNANKEEKKIQIDFIPESDESREKVNEVKFDVTECEPEVNLVSESPKSFLNDDELSVVTMESLSAGSNENNTSNSENNSQSEEKKEQLPEPAKKKRTYKPRKKKETPQSN
jgi:hypothetical protein